MTTTRTTLRTSAVTALGALGTVGQRITPPDAREVAAGAILAVHTPEERLTKIGSAPIYDVRAQLRVVGWTTGADEEAAAAAADTLANAIEAALLTTSWADSWRGIEEITSRSGMQDGEELVSVAELSCDVLYRHQYDRAGLSDVEGVDAVTLAPDATEGDDTATTDWSAEAP